MTGFRSDVEGAAARGRHLRQQLDQRGRLDHDPRGDGGRGPVVATAVGTPEVLALETGGTLVPARDPYRLARAVITLAEDAPRRTAIGRGRRRVETAFTVDRMVAEYTRSTGDWWTLHAESAA